MIDEPQMRISFRKSKNKNKNKKHISICQFLVKTELLLHSSLQKKSTDHCELVGASALVSKLQNTAALLFRYFIQLLINMSK